MLQKIRDRLQGVIAWFIIGALALVFAMWGASGFLDFGAGGARYAATVKSDLPWWKPAAKIPAQDVNRIYHAQLGRYQQMMGGEVPVELRARLQDGLLEDMVRNEVLIQHAQALGYRVSEDQVLKSVQQEPAFQLDGKYSAEVARSRLAQAGISSSVFAAEQHRQLQVRQLQSTIGDSAFVTPAELERMQKFQREQRETSWLVIPAASFAARIQPDEAAIKAYYDGRKREFMTPETVSLKYVRLRVEDVAPQVQVTEEGLRAYFETVKDLYRYLDGPRKGQQKTFEDARQELEGEYRKQEAEKQFGERQEQLADRAFEELRDLDAVARALNLPVHDIPVFTKESGGGDLAGQPAVIEAAFSESVLNGENSKPIELKPGDIVVVRSSGYRAAQQKPLAQVRETIVQALKEQMSRDQALKLAQQSADRLQAGTETLERLSADVKAKVEGPKFVGRMDEALPVELRNVLFATQRPSAQRPAIYKAAPLGNGDAAVLKLSGVRTDPTPQTPEQSDGERRQLEQRTAGAEFVAYLAELRSQAKVEKNPQVFQ